MSHHLSCRTCVGLRTLLALILLGGLTAASSASAAGPICRVTTSGTIGGNGSDWAAQAMALQTTLITSGCTEVWVAAGTYTPGTARSTSFHIVSGVAVYGGFSGTETARSQRNPAANLTTLSGEIGAAGNSDNSYSVVLLDSFWDHNSITASTVLDGFIISGGNANDSSLGHSGGGLYCKGGGSGLDCSPTLSNLTFSGNSAIGTGGAMYNSGVGGGISSPILNNVTFSGNSAGGNGGAMYNNAYIGTSSPSLSNVTFSDNSSTSGYGGAMYNYGSSGTSSPILSNVTFSGNSAPNGGGGAMYNRGDSSGTSSPSLANVTFSGNSAAAGGAMYNYGIGGTNSPTLSNVIAWGDTTTSGSPEIRNLGAAMPHIDHSVIQGSGGSGGAWVVGLGSDGGGNLDTDPALGPLADNGGTTQTLLPGTGSSAIDAGNDTTCLSSLVNGLDQRGVVRPQGPRCDIGAVEFEDLIFRDGFDLS